MTTWARCRALLLASGLWQVVLEHGFMDAPDVPAALASVDPAATGGLRAPVLETTYFLWRETVAATRGGGTAPWRERLFAEMSHNADGAADFSRLPDNSAVEIGTRVQI